MTKSAKLGDCDRHATLPCTDDPFLVCTDCSRPIFRLCRIQPPGAAPELSGFGNSSVFRPPLRPARRAAARWNGVEPRRQAVLDYLSRSRDGSDSDVATLPDPLIPRERL